MKRDGALCIVKAKITPEHRLRATAYNVYAEINEEIQEVVQCECQSCAASSGKSICDEVNMNIK